MPLNHSMDLDIDNVTKLISELKNTDVPKKTAFPLMATGSSKCVNFSPSKQEQNACLQVSREMVWATVNIFSHYGHNVKANMI